MVVFNKPQRYWNNVSDILCDSRPDRRCHLDVYEDGIARPGRSVHGERACVERLCDSPRAYNGLLWLCRRS